MREKCTYTLTFFYSTPMQLIDHVHENRLTWSVLFFNKNNIPTFIVLIVASEFK